MTTTHAQKLRAIEKRYARNEILRAVAGKGTFILAVLLVVLKTTGWL